MKYVILYLTVSLRIKWQHFLTLWHSSLNDIQNCWREKKNSLTHNTKTVVLNEKQYSVLNAHMRENYSCGSIVWTNNFYFTAIIFIFFVSAIAMHLLFSAFFSFILKTKKKNCFLSLNDKKNGQLSSHGEYFMWSTFCNTYI